MRLTAPQKLNTITDPVGLYETDPAKIPAGTVFVPKPNVPLHKARAELEEVEYTVKTNNLGLIQEDDYNGEGLLAGHVLGDSFAAGVMADIDKNYFHHLQSKLAFHSLLNLAVPGHGTFNQLYRLRAIDQHIRKTFHKRPAFVVLHVYLGNDVTDNASYVSQAKRIRRERLTNWLAEHLHLYRLYRTFNMTAPWSEKGPYGVPVNTEFRDATAVLQKYITATPLQTSRRALDQLVRYCREEHMKLLFVLIPTPEMASAALRRQYTEIYGKEARFDHAKYFFQSYARQRGIPTLSLTEFFLQQPHSETLFHVYDSHWTEEGQRKAANRVAEWLLEKLMPAIP